MVNSILGRGIAEGRFTDEDRQAYLDAWAQPDALTGGLNYYRAAAVGPPSGEGDSGHGNFAIDPEVGQLPVPTLVIWGEQDTALLTGNLEGLEDFVPDLTVKRIPDGSHWVIHEQPALVNAYIRAFLEGKETA
jgi:pimeloyl-ACP methyl ester carboxylesterase